MTSLLQTFSCLDDYDPDALPVDRARQIMLDALPPVTGDERVALRAALDRVLAADVLAPFDVPSHTNSAMDGWAVRHADLAHEGETRLRVIGTALAGRAFGGAVAAGDAVRIMTGAVLPAGADTVVMQELARADGEAVFVQAGQRAGQHIRRAGEDLRAGAVALRAGRVLRPAELGIVASLGIGEVTVRRRVRVAMFSTGDELASIGTPLAAGAVYDSNRYTLHGMLTRLGCEVHDLGVVRDDPTLLAAAFREAAQADAIVTSGGVSVGEADFIKQLMNDLGEVAFWKIAMKPGRPMAFGRIAPDGADGSAAWLFGLPGNPVAVMVTFYQFVRPALLRLAGVDPLPAPTRFTARSLEAIRKNPGRTEFQRGALSRDADGWCVRPAGMQGSGILSSMSQGDCFIVLDAAQGAVAAGDPVLVEPFSGLV